MTSVSSHKLCVQCHQLQLSYLASWPRQESLYANSRKLLMVSLISLWHSSKIWTAPSKSWPILLLPSHQCHDFLCNNSAARCAHFVLLLHPAYSHSCFSVCPVLSLTLLNTAYGLTYPFLCTTLCVMLKPMTHLPSISYSFLDET